jgi:alkylation response protein AidB-like acyl-CoA dehydrogenase
VLFAVTDTIGESVDPVADSPERAALRHTIRQLVERKSPPERVHQLDEAEEFDHALYDALARLGVLGIGAPAELGGAGDVRDQLVAVEELAAGPTSMAAYLIAEYAAAQVLARHGRCDEHRDVLRATMSGAAKVSFALSEPEGGTDVARVMRTRAERSPRGDFVLQGHKMWTTGATIADWIIVLARTSPPGRSAVDGITMFLVPARARGVTVQTVDTFGIRGTSTCDVFFDDVAVPADAVLGEVDAGMRQAFATVNREGLQAAAATLGAGRAALALGLEYAKERIVFAKPVGAFQVPQHWLVDGALALEGARSLMARAAEIEAAGGDSSSLASMAKLMASEACVEISLRGMQLMGGTGYTRAVAMQRYFRDGRLWSFSPLTNEMVRNVLGQRLLGLPRSY